LHGLLSPAHWGDAQQECDYTRSPEHKPIRLSLREQFNPHPSFIGLPRVPPRPCSTRDRAIGTDNSNDGSRHVDANDLLKKPPGQIRWDRLFGHFSSRSRRASCPSVSERACLFALDAVTSCEIYFLTQGRCEARGKHCGEQAAVWDGLVKVMSALHERRKLSVDD
jgi:hypothetical protein